MSPIATEVSDQIAPRAEHKASTHCKCDLKLFCLICLTLGFCCFGFFYKPAPVCE